MRLQSGGEYDIWEAYSVSYSFYRKKPIGKDPELLVGGQRGSCRRSGHGLLAAGCQLLSVDGSFGHSEEALVQALWVRKGHSHRRGGHAGGISRCEQRAKLREGTPLLRGALPSVVVGAAVVGS